jgi:uncharacterized protein (UPF0297 family)
MEENNMSEKNRKETEKEMVMTKNALYKIVAIFVIIFVVVTAAFIFGIYSEYKHDVTDTTVIGKLIEKVAGEKPEEEKTTTYKYFEITEDHFYNSIYDFIKMYFGEDDPAYIKRVTDAYMELFKRTPKDNQHYILYFIALCSVESNFRMSARSSVGAVGISQIMWSVWEDVLKKNYGISKESLYTSIEDNIYAGYMIWRNYLRKHNYNIKKANDGYLGTSSDNYSKKINFRYIYLINQILKPAFTKGLVTKEVVIE